MNRLTLGLVVLGVVVITGLWWMLVVGGVNERVAEADTVAQDLELQRTTLDRQLQELREAAEAEAQYTFALDTIDSSVPTEPQLDEFFEDIKAAADRTGVDIVAIGTAEPREYTGDPPADVLVIDLDLAVEAQFFELLGFLFELEDFERLIVLDSIGVSPGGGAADPTIDGFESDVLSVSITGSLFTRSSRVAAADNAGDE